jgi:hypothetical protein
MQTRHKLALAFAKRRLPTAILGFTNPDIGLDSRITSTRSTTANRFNSSAALTSTAIDVARANANQDYNPSTLAARGFLIEAGATNELLGSAVLATQGVTVTAAQRTLSFYGTGTVTLTGASTAGPLIGTGANNLVQLTFTPSAGTLTLTVSGSVLNAQLETGAIATSRITTVGSAVARGADNAVITALSSIGFSTTQGFLYCEFMMEGLGSTMVPNIFRFSDGTNTNRIFAFVDDNGSDQITFDIVAANVSQGPIVGAAATANSVIKLAVSWAAGSMRMAINGVASTEDTAVTLPTGISQLDIGRTQNANNYLNGWMRTMQYGPQLLSNAQLAAMTV